MIERQPSMCVNDLTAMSFMDKCLPPQERRDSSFQTE
jgi:hypothetical protein